MASAMRDRQKLAGSISPWALSFGFAALLIGLPSTSADAARHSLAEPGMVTVTVEVELTCPSCALGLERRLNRLDHVTGVEVRPADGRIALTVEPGQRLDLAAVRDTVRNAGFIPDGVGVVAVGRLTEVNGAPALALSPEFALPLAPGEPTAALVSEGSNRLLWVRGRWIGPPDDPGRLQVESFEAR